MELEMYLTPNPNYRNSNFPGLVDYAPISPINPMTLNYPGLVGYTDNTNLNFPGLIGGTDTDPNFPGLMEGTYTDPNFPGLVKTVNSFNTDEDFLNKDSLNEDLTTSPPIIK